MQALTCALRYSFWPKPPALTNEDFPGTSRHHDFGGPTEVLELGQERLLGAFAASQSLGHQVGHVLDVRVRAEQPSSMQQCSKYELKQRNHMQACLAHSLCHTAQNLCTGAIRGISNRVSTDQGLLSPHSVLSFCLYIL